MFCVSVWQTVVWMLIILKKSIERSYQKQTNRTSALAGVRVQWNHRPPFKTGFQHPTAWNHWNTFSHLYVFIYKVVPAQKRPFYFSSKLEKVEMFDVLLMFLQLVVPKVWTELGNEAFWVLGKIYRLNIQNIEPTNGFKTFDEITESRWSSYITYQHFVSNTSIIQQLGLLLNN